MNRDYFDNILAGIVIDVNFASGATEAAVARIIDRLVFAARTCERWFHAWRFITVTGSEVIWLFSGPFRRTF